MNTFASVISLPDSQIILRPRIPHLIGAFGESWRTWREDYHAQHVILNDSARAIIVNQNFYWHAQQRLNDDLGVRFLEDNLQRYMVFDEALIVRFKLLGGGLESHNYPTVRARQWLQQVPLPDFPKLARLNFGYTLDSFGTQVDGAFVTLPNGIAAAVNDWVWQVLGSPLDLTTFGIQLRFPPRLGQQAIVYDYDDYLAHMG
jgi:hypothetical protein